MLRYLQISHYALISQLNIDIPAGFVVITGETGAGKSILLGALGLLCGARADKGAIQAEAAKCVVEGEFNVSGLNLNAFFAENDIDFDGHECIVRREITTAGKSRAFLNDTPVPLTTLRDLAARIIDIHSQHQNLLMGEENFLLSTLDTIASNAAQREAYATAYAAWRTAEKALQQLQAQAQKGREDTDFMQFQLSQIDEAQLREGEQEELEQESSALTHAEDIKQGLFAAAAALQADEDTSTIERVRQAAHALTGISNVFPAADELASRLDSVRIELQDIADEAETALENADFDPVRAAFVDERLSLIYSLQKKHQVQTIAELLAIANDLRAQLDTIENIDALVEVKRKETEQLATKAQAAAAALTTTRTAAARALEKELVSRLHGLGMPHVSLQFQLSPRPTLDATGADAALCLFSANKGVPPQDAAHIASGGEMARLMLALKAEVAHSRELPTVVFDEIDTGVSGSMADKMAAELQRLAKTSQVLCITHLPQIAARGTAHFRVYKTAEGDAAAQTHIQPLNPNERVSEVAAMLSGEQLTDEALSNARVLLNNKR